MSLAGHILDMIKRIQQNRELQKHKRTDFMNSGKKRTNKSTHVNIPETPYEHLRDAVFSKILKLLSFIAISTIIVFLIYVILK